MKKTIFLLATSLMLFACSKEKTNAESLSGSWTMYDSVIVGVSTLQSGTPKVFSISKVNNDLVLVKGFPVEKMEFTIKPTNGKDSIMTQTSSGSLPSDIAMYDFRYIVKNSNEITYTHRQVTLGSAITSLHTGRCVKN